MSLLEKGFLSNKKLSAHIVLHLNNMKTGEIGLQKSGSLRKNFKKSSLNFSIVCGRKGVDSYHDPALAPVQM